MDGGATDTAMGRFPKDVSSDLRRWIERNGTRVQREWLRRHDQAQPQGLLEKIEPGHHFDRIHRLGIESYWYKDDDNRERSRKNERRANARDDCEAKTHKAREKKETG